MKVCTKCKIEKPFTDFSKDSNGKFGFKASCKCCFSKYRKNNIDKIKEQQKEYRKNNSHIKKEYYKNNIDKIQSYQIKYRELNKEKLYEQRKNWRYNKLSSDPLFKLSCNIRTLIGNSFNRGTNQFRKNAKTENILGCTIEEFKYYVENKFKQGMSWDNRIEWHLDHIIPISLATTEEEIIKLNHYTNFQPLWAEENIRKGNKVL